MTRKESDSFKFDSDRSIWAPDLKAIAPGLPLLSLLQETDPSLAALAARERTQRVRALSQAELDKLDF